MDTIKIISGIIFIVVALIGGGFVYSKLRSMLGVKDGDKEVGNGSSSNSLFP